MVASDAAIAAWSSPPPRPRLAAGAVHLWSIPLDRPSATLASLERSLTDDECTRAARFHFPRDRDRFIAARGGLRAVLASYLDRSPAALRFDYRCRCGRPDCQHERRKPALAAGDGGEWLRFNLSHSADRALIAVAERAEVGVDLERIEPQLDVLALAERTFAPAELATLRALAPAEQRAAFYAGWTRKEAYSKALGLGLTLDPSAVIVSLAPAAPAALLAAPGGAAEVDRWSLYGLTLGPNFAGALAVEGHHHRLSTWRWPADQAAG